MAGRLAGERVALREQSSGECRTACFAESRPFEQQSAESRVDRQPGQRPAEIGEPPVRQSPEPAEQLERLANHVLTRPIKPRKHFDLLAEGKELE